MRTTHNALLDRHIDSSMFGSINKQTIQTLRKVRVIAERAAKSPKDSLNWQKEVVNILTGGNKATNGKMGRSSNMVRTATAQVMNRTQLDNYAKKHVKRYQFVSLEAPNTCTDCNDLDGKIFGIADAEEGVHFPLMHYNYQRWTISKRRW